MEERGYEVFAPEEDEPDRDSEVFFNEKMLHNRDLSEIAGRVFREKAEKEEFRVCDPLAGSGIRGFRYSGITDRLIINDANPAAVENIERGLESNDIEAEVQNEGANVLLSEYRNFFHLVDVDPFGPFTPFLDSTARAANHESFVGLTATDNAAPAGSYPEVCRRRYASQPLKNSFMHETALRIYIKTVFENFARFDKCFDPKICFQERHYARVMGRVTESKRRTNRALDNVGHLSFCPGCRWRTLEREETCPECGSRTNIAGPLWTGKFVDRRFTGDMIEKMPEDWEESRELLERVHNEAEILTPFYDLHELCSVLGVQVPKRDEVIDAIRDKGYPVARTHFDPNGFRTDAPIEDVKQLILEKSD
ncbi:MAG: tRNA (guanine(10)-N(2))-dimethyltransferase [Candidatus Nanohaloarchaea archaeon]